MNCKLIAISKPVIPECNTAEELVAYCARVSNPPTQTNHDTAQKLLKYLAKNHHWSPFEMVNATIEINTTRDIARQILRHRSAAFQEFSTRYAVNQDPPVFREGRLQDNKNRQNSFETDDAALLAEWEGLQYKVADISRDAYDRAIEMGIAKEQARSLLPEGMTSSKLYMSASLRTWIHYCKLRMGNGTQKEHADIANECWKIITTEFPSLEGILDDERVLDNSRPSGFWARISNWARSWK